MERDIDYVIAVAECKSISQAAEILYISQPSLSRYLSGLEKELGVTLFVRTISGTELTEAGKIYVEYAKEIRRLRSTLKSRLAELKKTGNRNIHIGMALNSITLSIFDVADQVRARYPECNVEIFNMLSKDIPSVLLEKKCDFAIGPDLDWPQEFVCDRFYQDPYILVVPKRYHIEDFSEKRDGLHFPLVDLRRLPKMDYILQESTTAVRKGFDRICRHLNVQIEPRLLVTGSTLALQAAESQMGCCVVALGHLAFLNRWDQVSCYQLSDEIFSFAGIIRLREKTLLEEEMYCASCIKKAVLKGEQNILEHLKRV